MPPLESSPLAQTQTDQQPHTPTQVMVKTAVAPDSDPLPTADAPRSPASPHNAANQLPAPAALAAPLSKSAAKKQARRQRWLETRPQRRIAEKERKKTKRRQLAAETAAALAAAASAGLSDTNACPLAGQPTAQQKPSRVLMDQSPNRFRVVIDMDFENYMTDAEFSKAVQQINRVYSLNKRSQAPCQLCVTSCSARVTSELHRSTNGGFNNWDIKMTDLNYEDYYASLNNEKLADKFYTRDSFVYLTGDSENSLPDVDELLKDDGKVFVIGGLVDHNRHKNLCLRRAQERGIQTAKLPIREHVKLVQRHILSTVSVFEILLLAFGSHLQWPEVFRAAIPKRKLAPADDTSTKNVEKSKEDENDHCTREKLD